MCRPFRVGSVSSSARNFSRKASADKRVLHSAAREYFGPFFLRRKQFLQFNALQKDAAAAATAYSSALLKIQHEAYAVVARCALPMSIKIR